MPMNILLSFFFLYVFFVVLFLDSLHKLSTCVPYQWRKSMLNLSGFLKLALWLFFIFSIHMYMHICIYVQYMYVWRCKYMCSFKPPWNIKARHPFRLMVNNLKPKPTNKFLFKLILIFVINYRFLKQLDLVIVIMRPIFFFYKIQFAKNLTEKYK